MTDLLSQLAALPPGQRAALERHLRLAHARRPLPTPAGAEVAALPLTPAQRGMWFLEQLGSNLPPYNVVAAWRVDGVVDPAALRRAFHAVVDRHPALRTVFGAADGVPFQLVGAARDAVLQVEELTDTAEETQAAVIQRYAQREIRRRFDLATGPLVRLLLLRFTADRNALLLGAHHIVLDGWSLSIVMSDLMAALVADAAGTEPDWSPLTASFAEFVRATAAADRAADREFWHRALEGVPPALDLPTDRPRLPSPSFRGRRETFWLDAELTGNLRRLAHRCRGTLFTVLLAGWQALLSRYTGATDIPIGSPISIRPGTRFNGVVGLFLNTVVIRGDLAGDPGFTELVRRTSARAFDAYDHREYPFEQLADELATRRDLSRNPLFQVLLVLQNSPAASVDSDGFRLTPIDVGGQVAKFDLSLAVTEQPAGDLRCDLDWHADLFDAQRARRIPEHLRRLLVDAVARPDTPISELSLLTLAERASLRAWNRTEREVTPDSLPVQFARVATAHPERPALRFDGRWRTYAEVSRETNQLAWRLRRSAVEAETVVGVCLTRGPDFVVSLYAVQAAGGAYLPLDPEYPVDRLRFMVADAGAAAVVTTTEHARLFEGMDVAVVCLDAERAEIAQLPPTPPPNGAGPDNLAYVIYTSGSTGRPKGVGITQRAIVNRLAWMQDHFPLSPTDRVLQKTPMSFDVSVWEFFWPLCVGAGLVVAEPGGHRDSGYLVGEIARERVTTVHFVPSMLDAFCDEPRLAERLVHLRQIFTSGEALPAELAARCLRLLPEAALHNLYGPTEAAVDVTWQPCRGLDLAAGVPIGKAVPNTTLEILDPAGRQAPIGVAGELCLAGVQLARGYLNRPGLTAERFLPNPYGPPGSRLYRTGDLARWRGDGTVEYLGRLDHQVKIHGFRIELGEIEAALADQPEVRAAAVVTRGEGAATRLVAYLVASAPVDWAGRLRTRLPAHMVPDRYVLLDRLPVTHNGKLDRAALPDAAGTTPRGQGRAPATDNELLIAAVWRDVLDVAEVSADNEFFALGGDSIRSLKVVARLRGEGLAVTVADLFTFPTLRDLAAALTRSSAHRPTVEPAAPSERFDLLTPADRARLNDRKGTV